MVHKQLQDAHRTVFFRSCWGVKHFG